MTNDSIDEQDNTDGAIGADAVEPKKRGRPRKDTDGDSQPLSFTPPLSTYRRFLMPRRKSSFTISDGSDNGRGETVKTSNHVLKLERDGHNAKKFVEMALAAGGEEISKLLNPRDEDFNSVMAKLIDFPKDKLVAMLESEEDRAALRNHPAGSIAIVNHLLGITKGNTK